MILSRVDLPDRERKRGREKVSTKMIVRDNEMSDKLDHTRLDQNRSDYSILHRITSIHRTVR